MAGLAFGGQKILEKGKIAASTKVLSECRQAGASGSDQQEPFAPVPIDEVTSRIAADKPAVVFAPHVETSAGMILPDEYLSLIHI